MRQAAQSRLFMWGKVWTFLTSHLQYGLMTKGLRLLVVGVEPGVEAGILKGLLGLLIKSDGSIKS